MKSKMTKQRVNCSNEEGFALITALMIMLLLTILGIAANRNTVTELQIAGNDRLHKQTFYDADGGTEYGAEVLEQNIACLEFASSGVGSTASGNDVILDGNIAVYGGPSTGNPAGRDSLQLWQNGMGYWNSYDDDNDTTTPFSYPSDISRDMWYPPNYALGDPHTNITVEGTADLTPGSSLLFAAGYLGLGRSIASGGITLQYEIFSQHLGRNNSESIIRIEWEHVVGWEDPVCRYE